jgi:hypothetical protein
VYVVAVDLLVQGWCGYEYAFHWADPDRYSDALLYSQDPHG